LGYKICIISLDASTAGPMEVKPGKVNDANENKYNKALKTGEQKRRLHHSKNSIHRLPGK